MIKKKDREELAKYIDVECLPSTTSSNLNLMLWISRYHSPAYKGFPASTIRADIFRYEVKYQ